MSASQQRPLSLRLRFVMLAVVLMTVSLGLVGFALDSAFKRSSEAGLRARMESLVYLVLAATEVSDDGVLVVDDDLGDPRLGQPGSGIYAVLSGANDQWSSSSTLGVKLPEMEQIRPGANDFNSTISEGGFYAFRYGVSWKLTEERMLPVTVTVLVDPIEIQQEIRAFRTGLWRNLGVTGFIMVLAQMVLLTFGLKPLRRITRDISGIESGKLERLEGSYPRELEPLKRNLNHLLDTEKANQTRYRHALDSLAHSLKTPLSVIRSSLYTDSSSKVEVMEHAVTDMQRLIATRLQRAAISTRRSIAPAVDVEAQVDRLIQSLMRVHSQKMISPDVRIEPGLEFYGEQRDLLELAGNLLDNACKYGHGKLRITAYSLDSEKPRVGICVQVEDDGPGISEHEQEPLLQRGVRGDERVEGHGLGLAIVLEIVNAYNGEITIKQSDLGGACIGVSLLTHPLT